MQGNGVGAGGGEKGDAVLAAGDAVQGVGEDDMAVLVLAHDQGGVEGEPRSQAQQNRTESLRFIALTQGASDLFPQPSRSAIGSPPAWAKSLLPPPLPLIMGATFFMIIVALNLAVKSLNTAATTREPLVVVGEEDSDAADAVPDLVGQAAEPVAVGPGERRDDERDPVDLTARS